MLPGKKIGLTDILQALRRRVWLVTIPPMVTLFGALLYSSTLPDLYQSDMLIAIDPQGVPDSFVRSTVTLETDRRLDTLTVQVLSRTVLQELIEKFNLYAEERQQSPIEDVIGLMRKNVRIDLEIPRPRWGQAPQPTAFHVRFTHGDPHVATQVTQHLGQLFVEQNAKDRGNQAGATNRFLETQLAEARERLETQERRLEGFRERHGKALPSQMASNMQGLTSAQLQAQSLVESIARDRDRKQMLERLYRDAASDPAAPAASAATPTSPGGLPAASAAQQLAAARSSLSSLRMRYKPEHPDVARAERLVAELEPKAAAEELELAQRAATQTETGNPTPTMDPIRRENLRQMRAEIESLDRQIAFKESDERRVRAEVAEYQGRLEAVPGLESEWVALTRDYDTQQQAYKDLLAKSSAAQVAANLEEQDIGERFRIVDPATVPVHPLPAVRARINAGGLVLGLLLGLGLALLLEVRDSSFRTDADVIDVLSIPVLTMVPRIITAEEIKTRHRRRVVLSVAGMTCVALAGYVTFTLKLWKSLL
jgi:polysaccharide chain length determinant protein (PEP-CTERM system associated)